MKVKVVNSFKDADTGVIHGAGEVIDMTEERIEAVEKNTAKLIKDKKIKKGTVLIEKIQDDSKEKSKETEKKAASKENAKVEASK